MCSSPGTRGDDSIRATAGKNRAGRTAAARRRFSRMSAGEHESTGRCSCSARAVDAAVAVEDAVGIAGAGATEVAALAVRTRVRVFGAVLGQVQSSSPGLHCAVAADHVDAAGGVVGAVGVAAQVPPLNPRPLRSVPRSPPSHDSGLRTPSPHQKQPALLNRQLPGLRLTPGCRRGSCRWPAPGGLARTGVAELRRAAVAALLAAVTLLAAVLHAVAARLADALTLVPRAGGGVAGQEAAGEAEPRQV